MDNYLERGFRYIFIEIRAIGVIVPHASSMPSIMDKKII